jgi:hypothetical protein
MKFCIITIVIIQAGFRMNEERNRLGMVAQAYNPRFFRGRDWEDHVLRPA